VLDLDVQAAPATGARRLPGDEEEQLVERRQAVAGRRRPQGAQLGQGEVVDEPALHEPPVDHLAGTPAGELRPERDVGRPAELRVVADHQHSVAAHHEVGLDGVGSEPERETEGGQGVLGQVRRGAAMTDDQRAHAARLRSGDDRAAPST